MLGGFVSAVADVSSLQEEAGGAGTWRGDTAAQRHSGKGRQHWLRRIFFSSCQWSEQTKMKVGHICLHFV